MNRDLLSICRGILALLLGGFDIIHLDTHKGYPYKFNIKEKE
jgi:hypothetical protein